MKPFFYHITVFIALVIICTVAIDNIPTVHDALKTFETKEITNGTCGENVTWTFDDSTGIFTLSGNGKMSKCSGFSDKSNVKTIAIENGVKSIYNDAFKQFTLLTSITIPDSVTSIGSSAFEGCTSLTSITIPDSVTSISSSALMNW